MTMISKRISRTPDGWLTVEEEHVTTAEELRAAAAVRRLAADVADAMRGHGYPMRVIIGDMATEGDRPGGG